MKKMFSYVLLVVMLFTAFPMGANAKEPVVNAAMYADVFDAEYYASHNKDVAAAFGNNEALLFNHFYTMGMNEGRQGSEEFNVYAYMNRYADLKAAYGDDLKMYYIHYITLGKAEGRNAKASATVAATVTASQTAPNAYLQQVINKRNELVVTNGYGYKEGQILPEITMCNLQSVPCKTTDYLGMPMFITLYTPGNGASKAEIEAVNAMSQVHSNDVVSILVDADYSPEADVIFVSDNKIAMPVYMVDGVFGTMNVTSVPRHIVTDRYGKVIAYKEGIVTEEWIDEQLRKAAAEY